MGGLFLVFHGTCSPLQLHSFTFPPAEHKSPTFPTSSTTSAIILLMTADLTGLICLLPHPRFLCISLMTDDMDHSYTHVMSFIYSFTDVQSQTEQLLYLPACLHVCDMCVYPYIITCAGEYRL